MRQHTVLSVQQFLAARDMAVFPTLLTRLIWPSCDLFLFPRMKSLLRGCHFQDVSEVQE
jgi:hypothetical protein